MNSGPLCLWQCFDCTLNKRHSDCLKRGGVKEPDGPVDDDKGDRQQWVVDNRKPADFQFDL